MLEGVKVGSSFPNRITSILADFSIRYRIAVRISYYGYIVSYDDVFTTLCSQTQ